MIFSYSFKGTINNPVVTRYQKKKTAFSINHKSATSDSDSLNNSFDSQSNDINRNTPPLQQQPNISILQNLPQKSPQSNGMSSLNDHQINIRPSVLLPQHSLPLNMMHNNNNNNNTIAPSQFYQQYAPPMHPYMRGPFPPNAYMYPFNMMPPPPPHFFQNINQKQGLTDREEMDIKPAVDILNAKKPAQVTNNPATNIQAKKLNISSPIPIQTTTTTVVNQTNGVLTPTNEILPLNKPIISLEKIIQVDKKQHNKSKSQLTSKEELHKKIDVLLQEYLEKHDAANAVKTLKNYKFNHE
jgi:hypothetical protein